MLRRAFHIPGAGLLLFTLLFSLAGCGKEATPVTAATSKFRAGGASETTSPAAGAAVGEESSAASAAALDMTGAGEVGGSPDQTPVAASDAPPAAAGSATASSKARSGPQFAPPEGNVAQLKQYVIDLGSRELPGKTQQEKLAAVFQVVDLQLVAVNKILDAEPSAEDKTWVVSSERARLCTLARFHDVHRCGEL